MHSNNFQTFGLSAEILEALTMLQYIEPTPIQSEVIPAILNKQDILAKSQTGTGKTAAFAIPICDLLRWEEYLPQALILEPTRELAVQVKNEIFNIGRKKRLKVPALFGGMPVDKQAQSLKQKAHLIVGTPGRIMDHIRRGNLDLSNIKYFVIDEADLMLNMGFLEEVQQIIDTLPDTRVSMLFSATISDAVLDLVQNCLKNPVSITINSETETVANIAQELYYVDNELKYQTLLSILVCENPEECLVFCATREMVNTLYQKLKRDHLRCGMLHGELDQKERLRTIDAFRDGQFHYLICTDVAARGIDFDQITHVINYDFPNGKETYVHRVGRTGRNGKSGKAISFVTPDETKMKLAVEEFTLQPIDVKVCPEKSKLSEELFWKKQKEKTALRERKGAVFNQTITKISIGGGKKSKMRAADIVGTICSIEGITDTDIGIIDVRDSLTYVEILNGKGSIVLDALQNRTIKGKLRKVRITKR